MKMHCGTIDNQVVDYVFGTDPARIVSIDLETKVIDGNFLDGERILSVALSRRLYKNSDVETELFVLEEETNRGEKLLFSKLDKFMREVRPLITVGYNHRGYDLILLSQKLRKNGSFSLWGLTEMLSRCYQLDVMHAVRFAIAKYEGKFPRIFPLKDVINHPMFSSLPLMRTKSIVSDMGDKGNQIYGLYRNNQKKFSMYATGDSHDTLLIFEEIFKRQIMRRWAAA